jgi:hypothetical protein
MAQPTPMHGEHRPAVLPRLLLTAAVSSAFSLGTWCLLVRTSTARPSQPAATGELHPAPQSPSVDEAASVRELKEVRASVEALSGEVRALTVRGAPQPRADPARPALEVDGPAKAAPLENVTAPSVPVLQPVALPSPVPDVTPAALPSAEPNAATDRQEARSATFSTLGQLDERMSRGDADGASAALGQAAEVLGGAAGEELREAQRLVENEELATARVHIELALMRAPRADPK